jgi:hypothetical protein
MVDVFPVHNTDFVPKLLLPLHMYLQIKLGLVLGLLALFWSYAI